MSQFRPLDPEIVSAFNTQLRRPPGAPLCYAPFNNIAFNSQGYVGACFQSYFREEELRIPRASIREIWFSKQFQRLRDHIKNNDLSYKCKDCRKFMDARNFVSVPINGYRAYEETLREYPSCMEFELSNKCNLECIMCIGELSSNVRKNRDKLPPLLSPYDDKFVDQLREFIPHVKEMKFLGGEPTLIQVYYRIWELTIELNPSCLFFVTTNANALPSRFRALLEKGNFQMNVSIDSFVKETYEKIRINADFDTMKENLAYYLDYKKRKGKTLQVSFIPMTLNWAEVPGIISFGNKNGVNVWLHTLTTPPELHLKNLPAAELGSILESLRKMTSETDFSGPVNHVVEHNMNVYRAFLENQLPGWYREAGRN